LLTWGVLLALILRPALTSAQPASSADLERAEAKAIEAKAFFRSGLYAEAAAGFMQAFAISRRPDMMFNAARAYEEAAMPAQAIALFEQYQTLPDAPADGKREATQRIGKQSTQMEAQRAKAKEGQAAPTNEPNPAPVPAAVQAPVPAAAPAPVPAAAPAPVPAAAPLVAAVPAPVSPPSKALTISLLSGGGLLAVIGALSWAGAVNQINAANKMDFSPPDAAKTYRNAVKQAQDVRNFGIGAAVVGVGLAAWGGWRLWQAPPRAASEKSAITAVLIPSPDANGAVLALGGVF